MKYPDNETLALVGLIAIAGMAVVYMSSPDSVISAIAGGILGYIKGQSPEKVQQT